MANTTNYPKQLVILSGKGGTGKTSLSAALMHRISQSSIKGVFVDADVDAANLALVTEAKILESHPFTGSQIAHIIPEKCTNCGTCFDICRFNAIKPPTKADDTYRVHTLLCEGCSACYHECPVSAIQMCEQQDGEWYHSSTPYGHQFHAELFPAAENTGKLVTTIKQHAKLFAEDHQIPLMLIDGPPGIGCPVISASAGADLALLVAEPGVSGIHDLERIIKTLQHFKIPAVICINKADLYTQGTRDIHQLARDYDYEIVGEIPFDKTIPQSMVNAQPITRFAPQSQASKTIQQIWINIEKKLFQGGLSDA
ncbi:MAG: ATP-binding protein [Chloroflexota bacterium]|jgi:MinD superfamily P-loop ATPase|nr:ATP-binding protein [Chloroflexota bacterium]